jgi:hypothetical protein
MSQPKSKEEEEDKTLPQSTGNNSEFKKVELKEAVVEEEDSDEETISLNLQMPTRDPSSSISMGKLFNANNLSNAELKQKLKNKRKNLKKWRGHQAIQQELMDEGIKNRDLTVIAEAKRKNQKKITSQPKSTIQTAQKTSTEFLKETKKSFEDQLREWNEMSDHEKQSKAKKCSKSKAGGVTTKTKTVRG